MKRLFKLSYEYILLYLQLLFIALFVLVLLAYNMDIAAKGFLERRMVSENVQGIQMGLPNPAPADKDVTVQIPALKNADFMIYKYLVDGEEIWRGVYGTSDIFGYSTYISEGRFFDASDYRDKTKTAVIGRSILPRLVEENGKRYFLYNKEFYEVIGIFENTDTALDNAVYLNLTALLQNEDNMALYYVDAADSGTVSKVLSEMKKTAEGKFRTALVNYESNVTYMGLAGSLDIMLIVAVLSAAFNLLITVVFFVTHKKYKVAIQKLYGMTSRSLAWNYGKSILIIILAAFGSVIFVIASLSKYMGAFFTLDRLAKTHYIMMGGILAVLGVVTVYFIVNLARKVNISDSLKGR